MSHASHLYDAVVLAGLGGQHLVEEIAGLLGLPHVGTVRAEPSADGECNIRLGANCRGRQVFVVQSISNPSSDRLIELSLICSALRRSSARRIIAVTPYYAFGRQNRKVTSRVPISAADAAVLIEESGCDQVVAIDLHCGQIEARFRTACAHPHLPRESSPRDRDCAPPCRRQGFFSPRVGFDNVSCIQAAARHLFKFDLVDPVVVAIHATGVAFAKARLVSQRHAILAAGHGLSLGNGLPSIARRAARVSVPARTHEPPPQELFELLGTLAAEANARALERGASVDHAELPTFAMLLPASSARSGASGSELELIGEIQERHPCSRMPGLFLGTTGPRVPLLLLLSHP